MPLVTTSAVSGLDPRVRIFRHGTLVDTFAVITERFIALIDTGESPEAMEEVTTLLAPDRPLLVINSHGDWDHVWGNALFAPGARYPAPIVGHLLAPGRIAAGRPYLDARRAEVPGRYDSVRLVPPTILLSAGRLAGGDLDLDLIPTPGHTPDHLAVWIPQLRLLLAGDAAELPFPVVSDDGSLPELRASLRRMLALQPENVLYCHASGLSGPALIHRNGEYFAALERHARAGTLDSFGYEEAVPGDLPIDDAFYRRFHERNTRAAAETYTGRS
ncbi:MAG TPA: MBL fold metallo-hydrolase [Chloroflexota bacterium]|nr:MBL fold metallo-hydrolase [Chloroflexota bacterium]